ncbi:fuconate dehydratase [Micromonospora sp. PPF5-17]|uniref:L-fuconate dehydratase n=1 Tax=Micromonospora solifontis TaxID=2487138 RepID=A0ABX9WGZ5_9ACTN|nr:MULTISPECIES: enolase C-terminal domain-like protein [Micromonospora]NES37390.1 fuconate dehydratase [Micromonospora solifontis]NES58065.1 fuconate dehydratase [Micromonospora sp. PPF5-6]RNL98398.1 fuconate dehydratase [Micromonospora solifontis]
MTEFISAVDTFDVRFPTSRHRDGSDAMNPFPDYSAAYLVLRTTAGAAGHGLVFTVGRGTEVQVAAVRALAALVVGEPVEELVADPGALARRLVGDSQIRWLGPEKGVVHMAAGGIVNAVWDLAARRAGKPLWKLLADLTPEQLVAQVDFRYLRDALTEDEALTLLNAGVPGRAERERLLRAEGYPAYTTTPGWLGYDDEKLVRLCREAVDDGYDLIKLKVGGNLTDDVRRLELARQAVGPRVRLAVDANQIWGVPEAIGWMEQLRGFDPYWIEEPTSPDDVLGHAVVRRALAPIRVATGEHVHNAVMFKQLLQAGAVDVVQIDACRVGGVNENLAILLLAAKYGVPVCPHAGGVGLCELVQHLAMFDFVAVSGTLDDRAIEYVDHLHEHFVDPVRIQRGRYLAPTAPGMSGELIAESLAAYRFPDGPQWSAAAGGAVAAATAVG